MSPNPGLPLKRTQKAPGDHSITTPELRAWLAMKAKRRTPSAHPIGEE